MAHIYKLTEWQSLSGNWHCGDVEDLANGSNSWWYPCRLLGIAPTDFIMLLVEKYHVSDISYKNDTLLWSWHNQLYMRKYKNDINKLAREKNFII